MIKVKKYIVSSALALFFTTTLNAQVGLNYDFNVQDPAAFLYTMNTYMATEEASRSGATVILRQNLANGAQGTTHNLAVIWPDYASMQSSLTANAMSQTWSAFISSIGNAATQVGNSMFAATGLSTGNASVVTAPNQVRRFINFTVEPHNAGAYVEELQELWESCDDSVHHALYQITGTGELGWTHAVVQTAANLGDLLDGTACDSDATTDFFASVSDIREVKYDFVAADMMIWQP